MEIDKYSCSEPGCLKTATYLRHTKFFGSHPYCEEHAKKQSDFSPTAPRSEWEKLGEAEPSTLEDRPSTPIKETPAVVEIAEITQANSEISLDAESSVVEKEIPFIEITRGLDEIKAEQEKETLEVMERIRKEKLNEPIGLVLEKVARVAQVRGSEIPLSYGGGLLVRRGTIETGIVDGIWNPIENAEDCESLLVKFRIGVQWEDNCVKVFLTRDSEFYSFMVLYEEAKSRGQALRQAIVRLICLTAD